jgi:Tol biopolymer transport system component
MGNRIGRVARHVGLTVLGAGGALTGLSCGGDGGVTVPPTTGTLEITTATSGTERDPDGYAITIDDGTATPIGVNATLTREGVETGSHTVALTGVAANCGVAGGPSQNVTVAVGATARITFAVTCAATTGGITITTATTGSSLDPDGYTLSLDAGASQSIGINETLTISQMAPGSHSVVLAGLARNCQAQGENPRTVDISPRSTVTMTFNVSCAAIPPIVFNVSNIDGTGEIFLVNPDGTGLTELTDGRVPLWSPDKHKILFSKGVTSPGLFVINADGSGLQDLQVDLAPNESVRSYLWSPDGRRIAFSTITCLNACEGEVSSLYVMQADGSGQKLLTEDNGGVSWSPDGRKIAYTTFDGIYVIDLESDSKTSLIAARVITDLAWSPDGNRIAFGKADVRLEGSDVVVEGDIFLINPDGTGLVNVTRSPPDLELQTRWSPDGAKLAFVTNPYGVSVVNRDGSGLAHLTNDRDLFPDWSPDGHQLVFARHEALRDASEVWVMQTDGSAQRNVSNMPGTRKGPPDW